MVINDLYAEPQTAKFQDWEFQDHGLITPELFPSNSVHNHQAFYADGKMA